MTSKIHPELANAEATLLREDLRHIDSGTVDEIRDAYYALSDKLIALEAAIGFVREQHARDPGVTFLTSDQLAQRMETLRDAIEGLGPFGVAL